MNAKSTEILAQIKVGSVIKRNHPAFDALTVESISEKSVHFTDGKYTNKRSLFHYIVISS